MKLSEIARIDEADEVIAANGPVELADLLKRSTPEIAKKYIRALWGKGRLTFQGKPFFGSSNDVLDDIENALDAAKERSNEDGVDLSIEVPTVGDLEGFELNWNAPIDDQQQVYIGYDPKNDSLWVGTDGWLNEEDFNQAWDKEFEKHHGVEFNSDEEGHQEQFDAAFKEYRDMGFVGILYQMTGDPIDNADQDLALPGGFYKAIKRSSMMSGLKLIDLRLD